MPSSLRSLPRAALGLALLAPFACADDGQGDTSTSADAGTADEAEVDSGGSEAQSESESEGESAGDTGSPGEIVGLDLMTRLPGLWSGAATMTPLGNFEPMNMDLRAADGRTLFSRSDLDPSNSLRFAFLIETHAGQDRLVYRNGGYFGGMLRDSRTTIVEHTPVDANGAGSWRFCSVTAEGCDYIDALFEFEDADHLVFDVKVKGQQHVYWLAERLEARSVPEPFPADQNSQGTGDAPFPDMPSLAVTVSWQDPLAMPADVWVLLSTQDCPLMGFCDFSRSIYATAEVGATSIDIAIDQVHAGPYKANAILDRDQNLMSSFGPTSGDAVTLPNQPVEIAASGETTLELVTLVEI